MTTALSNGVLFLELRLSASLIQVLTVAMPGFLALDLTVRKDCIMNAPL